MTVLALLDNLVVPVIVAALAFVTIRSWMVRRAGAPESAGLLRPMLGPMVAVLLVCGVGMTAWFLGTAWVGWR